MVTLNLLCMKDMNNLRKYKKGIITMEIESFMPEKFINLLWKNGIVAKNITKINITTLVLQVKLSDYVEISKVAKKTNTKIVIIGRNGLSFFLMKIRSRYALLLGVILFACIIYYLSTFVWSIQITTERYISPYELRNQIKGFGVTQGIRKKNIDNGLIIKEIIIPKKRMKICSICKRELTIDNFGKCKRTKEGHRCDCKDCHRKSSKEYRTANKDKIKESSKQYRKKNHDKLMTYSRKSFPPLFKTSNI